MKATKTRAFLLAAVLLLTPNWAFAVTRLILEIPHDDVSVRHHASESPASQETAGLLWLIESLAIADRSKKSEAEFPYCFAHLTKEQVEKKLGMGVDLKEIDYARPCAGTWIVPVFMPRRTKAEDLDHKFYELKDVGGVLVCFTPQGEAATDGVVYLKTDDKFVPLKEKGDITKRLEWETHKLRQLKKWLSIPEDVAISEKGELAIVTQPKATRPTILTEPPDPKVRVLRDYGEMGQEQAASN